MDTETWGALDGVSGQLCSVYSVRDQGQRFHTIFRIGRTRRSRWHGCRGRNRTQRWHCIDIQRRSVGNELVESRQIQRMCSLMVILRVHLAQRRSHWLNDRLNRVNWQLGLMMELHYPLVMSRLRLPLNTWIFDSIIRSSSGKNSFQRLITRRKQGLGEKKKKAQFSLNTIC